MMIMKIIKEKNENIQFNTSTNDRPFRRKCYACGELGHRVGNCEFLKKWMSCLKHMKSNNISTSRARRVCNMNNDDNEHASKSNFDRLLQDQNFIPFENVGSDAFINVLEKDTVCHIIDGDEDHDDNH